MPLSAILAGPEFVEDSRRRIVVYILIGVALGSYYFDYPDLNKEGQSSASNIDRVIDYWSQTGLGIQHASHFISFEECDNTRDTREHLACQMAEVRLKQVCQPEFAFNTLWTGIEKYEAQYLMQNLKADEDKQKVGLGLKVRFQDVLQHCNPRYYSYAIASAVNSYLSIKTDPHSYIMPIKYFDEVVSQSDVRQNLFGLLVRRNQEMEWIITRVSSGSSAEKLGLIPGDKILELQNQKIESLSPKEISDYLNLKTNLNLVIERLDSQSRKKLFRIQLHPTHFSVVNVKWDWANREKKVGVIRIEKFSRNTCDDFKKALMLLKTEDMRGLIIDLRDNPGGSVDEASCVMDTLVPKGQILFYTFDQKKNVIESYQSKLPSLFQGGVAVLINQGSASASEIVAGGLKSLNRAKIVGQRSFGKGTYQDGIILDFMPSIVYFETRGYYFFADGSTAQLKGVAPDLEVPTLPRLSSILREGDLYLYPLDPNPQINKPKQQLFVKLYSHLSWIVDSECLTIIQNKPNEIEQAVEAINCQNNF